MKRPPNVVAALLGGDLGEARLPAATRPSRRSAEPQIPGNSRTSTRGCCIYYDQKMLEFPFRRPFSRSRRFFALLLSPQFSACFALPRRTPSDFKLDCEWTFFVGCMHDLQ
jgi:hypothetical protein